MPPIKTIAVIGATGRLGAPVATELAKTFQVRAIVRSPDKAKAMLPAGVEVVKADLRDVDSLRAALQGVDAIYLNLATETADPNLPFYEEREGVANLLAAIRGLDIRYIAKIGALGAYARQVARAFHNPEAVPADVPVQGPEAITVGQALKLFVANYDPTLKIRVAPVWIMRIIGLFNPRMRFVAHLFAYFGNHEDPFYAAQTWKELGKPTVTLVEFAKGLRRKAALAG